MIEASDETGDNALGMEPSESRTSGPSDNAPQQQSFVEFLESLWKDVPELELDRDRGGYRMSRLKRAFFVRAVWDAEAEVFISETDIEGLHVEAKDLESFQMIVEDTAAELIINNHVSLHTLSETPLKDLIPAIVWRMPVLPAAA